MVFTRALKMVYGSALAYNVKIHSKFSLSKQPAKFLFRGWDPASCLAIPVRDAFPREFMPTFYSEVWGDYLCYFLIYGKDAAHNVQICRCGVGRQACRRQSSRRDRNQPLYYEQVSGAVNLVPFFRPSYYVRHFAGDRLPFQVRRRH